MAHQNHNSQRALHGQRPIPSVASSSPVANAMDTVGPDVTTGRADRLGQHRPWPSTVTGDADEVASFQRSPTSGMDAASCPRSPTSGTDGPLPSGRSIGTQQWPFWGWQRSSGEDRPPTNGPVQNFAGNQLLVRPAQKLGLAGSNAGEDVPSVSFAENEDHPMMPQPSQSSVATLPLADRSEFASEWSPDSPTIARSGAGGISSEAAPAGNALERFGGQVLSEELEVDVVDPYPAQDEETLGCRALYKARCGRLIECQTWQRLFMVLTFYALFSADLDSLLGNKTSAFAMSVATTVAFALFLLELLLQSYAKPGYFLRAYFFLDLVALISLLPDTLFVQLLFPNRQFVAARSSKISRILRAVSRSTRASRLNRLTRIVRVAALVPRILGMCGGRGKHDETKAILEKKLKQIFAYVDEDGDGYITQERMQACVAQLKETKVRGTSTLQRATASATSLTSSLTSHLASQLPAGLPRSLTLSSSEPVSWPLSPTLSTPGGSPSRRHNPMQVWNLNDGQPVHYEDFKRVLMLEDGIRNRMTLAATRQVRRSNNMRSIAKKHSEDLGVKVALGVLMLLLVLSIVDPGSVDYSDMLGLSLLDTQVRVKEANGIGTEIPNSVRDHVAFWSASCIGETGAPRKAVYLDVRYNVFCDEFVPGGGSCLPAVGASQRWTPRKSMQQIDKDLEASNYRLPGDIVILRLPSWVEDATDNFNDAQLNETVTTLALLDNREQVKTEAKNSLMTTGLVICIILTGIVLLTWDMTYLSKSLLKPLRVLAEEMRAIANLQLAGMPEEKQPTVHSTAEMNLIQQIFDNMKRAIKSWGKYVPWPVVQILLHAGVDATPGVSTKEVTIFFSDIASFTSIVERLPPESSLLLLSKYFNDMSRVIDDNNGIVIEFIGDAILAVYGAPIPDSDHATSGVRATLRMLDALERLNEWSLTKGLPEVKIRCGVHTGNVLIGNMGFHSRMKYGVLGEHANIPSRLEEMNKNYGTNNLMSESTLAKLKRGAFVIRPIDWVCLRTSSDDEKPEVVYQVLAREKHGKPHRLRPVAQLHARAMKRYRTCKFAEAAAMFEQVNVMMMQLTGVEVDGASNLLMRRSLVYKDRPPRPDWNGVWDQGTLS